MKGKIKVLSLCFPYKGYDDNTKFILEDLERHEIAITPKFNRDGIYYNRFENISWIEYGGKAFLYSESQFLHELNLFNHTPLSNSEVQAIKHLMNRNIDVGDLRKLFLIDRHWKELVEIRRSTHLFLRGR